MMTDPSVIAAFLSAIATALAAYATWKGPAAAAEIAEKLRRASEADNEKRRIKTMVFYQLMQERSTLSSADGVKALNLIDVVFSDNRTVREAWSALYESFDTSRQIPAYTQNERLRHLLKEIAEDLGLASHLRIDDLERVYYPNAIAQEHLLRSMERDQALARLQGQPPNANTTVTDTGLFPPRPTDK